MRYAIRQFVKFGLAVLLLTTAPATGRQNLVPPVIPEGHEFELYQSLLDLQSPWTVMCVAAHPDDEDGATLTILRRKHGVHTVSVFSTFGEGGQNAVGPELYEELGAMRARETLDASKIQGSEPYFLGLRDFGFSKRAEEAFQIWGHDESLRRLVLKIRELRPDVIITNHDTAGGHGHHQATGRLVLEAFEAAADGRRFPEQLRAGLSRWQVQRIFVRFQFQADSASKSAEDEATRASKIVALDPNERDPMRGMTYAEQALQALQRHATQGPWPKTLPAAGRPVIRYRLVRSAQDSAPLPSNSQTVIDGLQLPEAISDRVMPLAAKAILQMSRAEHHQSILSALVSARKGGLFDSGVGTRNQPRFRLMQDRLDQALVAASRIRATLTPLNDVLIPDTVTQFSLKISNEGESAAAIQSINSTELRQAAKLSFPRSLGPGEALTVELQYVTPRAAKITVPTAEHLYDSKLFGEALAATVQLQLDGAAFPLKTKVQLDVAPAVEIADIAPSRLILIAATQDLPEQTGSESRRILLPDRSKLSSKLTLRLINHRDETFNGEIMVEALVGGVEGRREQITLRGNETREISVQVGSHATFAELGSRGRRRQLANSLPVTIFEGHRAAPVTQRKVDVVWADARVAPRLKVGYIKSFDNTLSESLHALGVDAKELGIDDVRTGELKDYHAIIIDNRGYQAHPELVAANARLLDYARDGGTLIVFYHRTNEWNPDPRVSRPQLAPYPILLSNARVTDETAPIEFTDPKHPLLNYPNKIVKPDFDGWIQERGLYYPQTWDPHYSELFATNDVGEKPLRGGLLVTDYGRGRYIYTSMVWYRQLREGVPGAYRMLANMISYGREAER